MPHCRQNVLLVLGLLLAGALDTAPVSAQAESAITAADQPDDARVYAIRNAGGVIDIQPYRSGSYEQLVERISADELRITTRILQPARAPTDPFPLAAAPSGMGPYLRPTRYIQSDDPAITAVARSILAEARPQDQAGAVAAVLAWNRGHMRWALPNEVPDALTALQRGTGNCIGFVHLPAAILRNMGIPARTVRTFAAQPSTGHLVPHYLLEVYFASDDRWITYEPQIPGAPLLNNIVLYTDPDWSVEGQRATRPFSRDPATRVLGGIPASGPLDFDPPEVRDIVVRTSGADVSRQPVHIEITVDAHDDGTGVEYMSASFFFLDSHETGFHLTSCRASRADATNRFWTCTIAAQPGSPAGTYRVHEVSVVDHTGNVNHMYGDRFDPFTGPFILPIRNDDPELTLPVLTAVRIDPRPGSGRVIIVTSGHPRNPAGEPADFVRIHLYMPEQRGSLLAPPCERCDRATGQGCHDVEAPAATFVCNWTADDAVMPGRWAVSFIQVKNSADAHNNIHEAELRAAGFPIDFEVDPRNP